MKGRLVFRSCHVTKGVSAASRGAPPKLTSGGGWSAKAIAISVAEKRAILGAGRPHAGSGPIINSGRTMASKSSAGTPAAIASSRRVVPLAWADLAILAARS